ncbi:MAG TPA: uroporphyrinogen decarboxylase family protein [Methanomassiliicoccales archaeon]|nr:uroporphyrinogen decarboxylase family protein [Methanomassiliicoccales archaeon]
MGARELTELTSKERVIAAIEQDDCDRIPIAPPFQGYWALGLAGLTVKESIQKPVLAARAQIEANRRCGFDALESMWDWLSPVEALGCEVKIPESGEILTGGHLICGPSSLDSISVPEPTEDYRFISAMEASKRLTEAIGDKTFLYGTLCCPFTLIGELRGVEPLMLDIVAEPSFAIEMLHLATEALEGYCEYLVRAGVDGVILCDPTASGSLVSGREFEVFSQPFMKQCGRIVKKEGGKLLVHICGDATDRLHSIADIGSEVFSLDYQVDLRAAKEAIGDKLTLLGNVNPSLLFNGRPGDVKKACHTCVSKTHGERFILGAGCDIVPGTPIENIEVWKEEAFRPGTTHLARHAHTDKKTRHH